MKKDSRFRKLAGTGLLGILLATVQGCQVRVLLNAPFDQYTQGTVPGSDLPGDPPGDALHYFGPDGGIWIDRQSLRFNNLWLPNGPNPGPTRVDLRASSIGSDRRRKLYYCWAGRAEIRTPNSPFTIDLLLDLYGQGRIASVRFDQRGRIALAGSEQPNDFITVSTPLNDETVLFLATVDPSRNRYRLQIMSNSSPYDSGERPFSPPLDARPWFPCLQLLHTNGTRNAAEASRYWLNAAFITQDLEYAQEMMMQTRATSGLQLAKPDVAR